jgi:hypothetical protein
VSRTEAASSLRLSTRFNNEILMQRTRNALTGLVLVLLAAGCTQREGSSGASRDFEAAFASCAPGATFTASMAPMDVRVRYAVLEPAGDGCRVSMKYESNPNPEWEDKFLILTLNPQHAFLPQFEEGMQSCLSGGDTRFDCAGPLLEVLQR